MPTSGPAIKRWERGADLVCRAFLDVLHQSRIVARSRHAASHESDSSEIVGFRVVEFLLCVVHVLSIPALSLDASEFSNFFRFLSALAARRDERLLLDALVLFIRWLLDALVLFIRWLLNALVLF